MTPLLLLLFGLFVLLGSSQAREESTFHCEGPDPAHRTCHFTNICFRVRTSRPTHLVTLKFIHYFPSLFAFYSSLNFSPKSGQPYFITSKTSQAEKEKLEGAATVLLGTYTSHPEMKVKAVTPSELKKLSGGGSREIWEENVPAVFYFSPSEMYYHWLLDDTLGLFWLLKHHNLIDADVKILLHVRRSSLALNWQVVFTNHSIDVVGELGNNVHCFSNLYAGPSGNHFGGVVRESFFCITR